MEEKNREIISIGTRVGAVLGGITFLIFGVVPGFHYGGYGALMLFSKLADGPVDMTLGVRLVIALGIILGILCLGFMGIVLGSILGTAAGFVVNALGLVAEREEEEVEIAGHAARIEAQNDPLPKLH
jgi:hypothetical protein